MLPLPHRASPPLTPLSDCNLLFRFICQNIFPVPCFDKGAGKQPKAENGNGYGNGTATATQPAASGKLQLHCCTHKHTHNYTITSGKLHQILQFLCCILNNILSTFAIPFPFTCVQFQIITSGHKWSILNCGFPLGNATE